jgi:Putative transposase DNA-binding domain
LGNKKQEVEFLANVETTRELRKTNRKIRYPYKDKRFYPLYWPAQAVSVERGTSSQCPVCGWKQKVKGRVWRCRNPQCAFVGHRDVVGSVNMHPLAFGTKIAFPAENHVSTSRTHAGPGAGYTTTPGTMPAGSL